VTAGYFDFFGDGAKESSDAVVGTTDTRAAASDDTGSRYAFNAINPNVRIVPTIRKYLKSGMAPFSDADAPPVDNSLPTVLTVSQALWKSRLGYSLTNC
jgi:hypothetical protein